MRRVVEHICALLPLAVGLAAAAPAVAGVDAREVLPLDGEWGIVFDRADEGRAASWWTNDAAFAAARPIAVPSCWEETEKDYEGVAWYRRAFAVPAAWKGRCVRLEFDAVNYLAEVWVNGQPAGDHEGGYTPFDLEVSDLLAYGAPTPSRCASPGRRFGATASASCCATRPRTGAAATLAGSGSRSALSPRRRSSCATSSSNRAPPRNARWCG